MRQRPETKRERKRERENGERERESKKDICKTCIRRKNSCYFEIPVHPLPVFSRKF